jgi:hypothetical protein
MWGILRRRWIPSPSYVERRRTRWKRMLRSLDLLLSSTKLSQCVLDVLCHVGLEHRARVHGLGHRHLPRLQQAFHILSGALVHDKIGIHEGSVEVAANVNGVWGADIFDN